MNEVNHKKRTEKTDNTAWKKMVETAKAEKASYLSKFEGRSMGEKYRLAQERVEKARAEKREHGKN